MAQTLGNLVALRNSHSGVAVACTARNISDPYSFRTAITSALGQSGGVDGRGNGRDPMDVRTYTADLIHVYGPGETFTSVWDQFDRVLNSGWPVHLAARDAPVGTAPPLLWFNVARGQAVNRQQALDNIGHAIIPVTFIMPDPYWQAEFKANVPRADTGLYADTGLFADDDPDSFPLTGTATSHTIINNVGNAPDVGPVITLVGPMPGPVAMLNRSNSMVNDQGVEYFRYLRSILAGETVTIDCGAFDAWSTNAAADAFGAMQIPVGQESWLTVLYGTSALQFLTTGAPGAGASVNVAWKPRKS